MQAAHFGNAQRSRSARSPSASPKGSGSRSSGGVTAFAQIGTKVFASINNSVYGSTDDGATWDILRAKTSTDTDPNGNSFLPNI